MTRARPVGVWLFAVAGLIVAMVIVGGATRLTGSGLSITEWKPVTGALPPLSQSAWTDLFAKYRASSQYRLINQGLSLGAFKVLFWWEWAHRLLGRTVGVVFAIPFALFLVGGRLPRRLIPACWVLFGLGGLQGLVGWWMVKSGLEGRASVAPERLATHLGLALLLLAATVWVGASAWSGPRREWGRGDIGWRVAGVALLAGVFVQCLLGALLAGTHGGMVEGDWPLMGGRFIPADYWQGALWATVAHGTAATQFDHRMWSYALWAYAALLTGAAARGGANGPSGRGLMALLFADLSLQALLGIAVVRLGDPLWLALPHQANAAAMVVLSTLVAWRWWRG